MIRLSLDQRRAKHALERIKRQRANAKQSEYLSYAKALPASIQQNGLGQALATLLAAAKNNHHDPHYLLFADIQDWLCGDDDDAPYRNARDLLAAITCNDQQHYLHAHDEAQGYLNWLKKFSAAYLDTKTPKSKTDG
jgi:CRISPR-associated protein Cmr5